MLSREEKQRMWASEAAELDRVGQQVFPSGPDPKPEFDLSVIKQTPEAKASMDVGLTRLATSLKITRRTKRRLPTTLPVGSLLKLLYHQGGLRRRRIRCGD